MQERARRNGARDKWNRGWREKEKSARFSSHQRTTHNTQLASLSLSSLPPRLVSRDRASHLFHCVGLLLIPVSFMSTAVLRGKQARTATYCTLNAWAKVFSVRLFLWQRESSTAIWRSSSNPLIPVLFQTLSSLARYQRRRNDSQRKEKSGATSQLLSVLLSSPPSSLASFSFS